MRPIFLVLLLAILLPVIGAIGWGTYQGTKARNQREACAGVRQVEEAINERLEDIEASPLRAVPLPTEVREREKAFDEFRQIEKYAVLAEQNPECFTAEERASIEAGYRRWREEFDE